jgi:hypothetical protein
MCLTHDKPTPHWAFGASIVKLRLCNKSLKTIGGNAAMAFALGVFSALHGQSPKTPTAKTRKNRGRQH